jgi:3-isopropylmalate dehydrogenase
MLRYSFDLGAEADLVEKAVRDTLAAGIRTGDIARAGETRVSTRSMGDAVLDRLAKAV